MPEKNPEFVPEGVDLERPNPARIYDWFLGGSANWAIDRAFGEKVLETFPNVRNIAKVGRDFLGRGVHHLARQGVTQFLDLGSGVPTVGNVHEIADSVNPDSRCVYVDNEPVAVAHSQVLLERHGDPDRHAVLHGDLREPDEIWRRAMATGVLDPDRPIGLIVVGVLYFLGPATTRTVSSPATVTCCPRAPTCSRRTSPRTRSPTRAAPSAKRSGSSTSAPVRSCTCGRGTSSPRSSTGSNSWSPAWCGCPNGTPTSEGRRSAASTRTTRRRAARSADWPGNPDPSWQFRPPSW
jgi:hypothetical protein